MRPSAPAHLSTASLRLPCDSTERECVQSAAEFRLVQGHDHEKNVCGALLACPGGPQPLGALSPCVCRLGRRPILPACPPGCTSRPASCMPSYYPLLTRQNAWAFNQPLSFDTSKVTTMFRMFAVRSARARVPNLESSPPPRACAVQIHSPRPICPFFLPARTPRPASLCLSFDSVGGVGIQSAAELRHV